MLKRMTVLSCLIVLILSVSAFAAPQKLINYQGKLTNLTGSPETGSKELTFKLYAVETGGSSIWDETLTVAADSAGQFSAILGEGNHFGNVDLSQSL